ncbi:MAG TPA: SDR family NAD(P)-dependent oxidoreductase [Microlunatus sp.]|nr:SDR family NAD(P)-dependent oxidoreductase [Microlunatus sp.]
MSTILITGGSAGLGRQTATDLAEAGHRVLLAVRNPAKGEQVAAEIRTARSTADVEVLECDLADLSAVRRLAALIIDRPEPVDAVICNAGLQIVDGVERSVDGYELSFAINHLAHFLLVTELLDHLRRPARVIMIGSGVHHGPTKSFGFPAPQWTEPRELALATRTGTVTTGTAGRVRYANSKLANIMFTYELARRCEGDAITVNAFDPGLMPETGLDRQYPPVVQKMYHGLAPLLTRLPGARRVADSAADLAWLATAPELSAVTGKYFVGRQAKPSSPQSYDQELARQLWQQSAELTSES